MDYIKHTYTIQWVGPMDYETFKKYQRNPDTLSSEMFNFYYFEAQQDGRYSEHTYLGIHKKNDGINHRLNTQHEHLGPYIKSGAKSLKIWIGSLAQEKDQVEEKIDLIETLFISGYDQQLTDNIKKKMSLPPESVCIVNMFYDTAEEPTHKRINHPKVLDDILVYSDEEQRFYHSNLRKLQ